MILTFVDFIKSWTFAQVLTLAYVWKSDIRKLNQIIESSCGIYTIYHCRYPITRFKMEESNYKANIVLISFILYSKRIWQVDSTFGGQILDHGSKLKLSTNLRFLKDKRKSRSFLKMTLNLGHKVYSTLEKYDETQNWCIFIRTMRTDKSIIYS